jgi:integrase/recombinase XerD
VRSRNTRLAAIHSLFRFAALRHPEHADLIARVLAIPPKRCDRAVVSFLDEPEIEELLAPDASRWIGRRDRALLMVAVQTGLRVSELTGLRCRDVHLGHGAHVRCLGKGRKQRCTPLTSQTVAVLQAWLRERQGQPDDPRFATSHGRALSCDAVAWLLTKHAATAQQRCPSIGAKAITPHVLRHSCAMTLLRAGADTSVIALWLGHKKTDTVQIYVHADLALKERALARTTSTRPRTAAAPRTRCSPSSRRSDYAERRYMNPLPSRRSRRRTRHNPALGIMGPRGDGRAVTVAAFITTQRAEHGVPYASACRALSVSRPGSTSGSTATRRRGNDAQQSRHRHSKTLNSPRPNPTSCNAPSSVTVQP